MDRCLKAREQVAAYALVVDAKDDAARQFYLHHRGIGKTESDDFTYSWIRHILENMDAAGAVFAKGHASYSN